VGLINHFNCNEVSACDYVSVIQRLNKNNLYANFSYLTFSLCKTDFIYCEIVQCSIIVEVFTIMGTEDAMIRSFLTPVTLSYSNQCFKYAF
jgi:hypothetical protein